MALPCHESAVRNPDAVAWAVMACGMVRATSDELLTIRKNQPKQLPGGFFKHADEQTVAGVTAVFQAVQSAGLETTSFADWGVVAGACFLGRTVLASAMAKFAGAGAWSVSPHLIPNHTQHCLAGSVSIALKSHGMNVGVGGGTETVSQTMLAAAGLASDDRLAGLWIVMTDHAPHPFTVAAGGSGVPVCHALAFALVKASADLPGARLRVLPTGWTSPNDTREIRSNPLRVADLTRSLAGLDGQNLRWQLDCGGWLEWQPDRARRILQPCEATPPSGSPV